MLRLVAHVVVFPVVLCVAVRMLWRWLLRALFDLYIARKLWRMHGWMITRTK